VNSSSSPENRSPLPRDFYLEPTTQVAQSLLGHLLLRNTAQGLCGGIIVETEAYLSDDPACHAYQRQTTRNRSMWGEPGMAYVYRIYGSYKCFNAVCGEAGHCRSRLGTRR
jgi:DNA-3-methyladenine glycosylase